MMNDKDAGPVSVISQLGMPRRNYSLIQESGNTPAERRKFAPLGTDYGPVPIRLREHIDIVRALGLGKIAEEKILGRNVEDLLELGLVGEASSPRARS